MVKKRNGGSRPSQSGRNPGSDPSSAELGRNASIGNGSKPAKRAMPTNDVPSNGGGTGQSGSGAAGKDGESKK